MTVVMLTACFEMPSPQHRDAVILDGGHRRPAVLRGRVAVFAVVVFLTMLACLQLALVPGGSGTARRSAQRATVRRGVVCDRRRHDSLGVGCVAAEHRRRDHHLRCSVLRHPTLTLQLPASLIDPLRAVPTLQPRRRVDRRQFRLPHARSAPGPDSGCCAGTPPIMIRFAAWLLRHVDA